MKTLHLSITAFLIMILADACNLPRIDDPLTVPSVRFIKILETGVGYSVKQSPDGGYILCGGTSYTPGTSSDVLLIKTDMNGMASWSEPYNKKDIDAGKSVFLTSDDGYIICGYAYENNAAPYNDLYLMKASGIGNKLWDQSFGGALNDVGNSLQQTKDGGYILCGYTFSSGAGSSDVYLIKTDNTGGSSWTNTFGGSGADEGNCIQQTKDDGYIICGSTTSVGNGGLDVYLVKTNATGGILWSKTYVGTASEVGYSVQQTEDGGYIVCGYKHTQASEDDVYLIKTNSDGDTTWTKTYGGADDEKGYAVQQTTDKGYIICGFTKSQGAGNNDVYLIKTDQNGMHQWSKTFGGTGFDFGYSVQQTLDGGYILCGTTQVSGVYKVYLIKTDREGNAQ